MINSFKDVALREVISPSPKSSPPRRGLVTWHASGFTAAIEVSNFRAVKAHDKPDAQIPSPRQRSAGRGLGRGALIVFQQRFRKLSSTSPRPSPPFTNGREGDRSLKIAWLHQW